MRRGPAPLLLVLVALAASPAAAGDTPPPTGLPERIGSPADPSVVQALISTLDVTDTPGAIRLANALGYSGGYGALDGLASLIQHPSEEVRLAALEALARVGLRAGGLARHVRRIAHERASWERRAAVSALAVLGDGRDVPLFLSLAAEEDRNLRATCFRALARLTGASVPPVRARWSWYWKQFSARAALMLPHAIDAMEEDAEHAPDLPALEGIIRLYGWTDLPVVEESLRTWLVQPRRELRAVAARLAGELGLADLVDPLMEAHRFANASTIVPVEASLRALGAVPPSRAPGS